MSNLAEHFNVELNKQERKNYENDESSVSIDLEGHDIEVIY